MEDLDATYFAKFCDETEREELIKAMMLEMMEDDADLEEEFEDWMEEESGEKYCRSCQAITDWGYRMTHAAGVSPEEGVYFCVSCRDDNP